MSYITSVDGFCDLEVNISTLHGNYTWAETVVSQNSSSDCQFGPEDDVDPNMAAVTRNCQGPHDWAEYYGGDCITEVTAKIRALGNVSVCLKSNVLLICSTNQRTLASAEDVADVVGQLNTIFSEGTSTQDQSEGNLMVVLTIFSGAADLAENVSYTETVNF